MNSKHLIYLSILFFLIQSCTSKEQDYINKLNTTLENGIVDSILRKDIFNNISYTFSENEIQELKDIKLKAILKLKPMKRGLYALVNTNDPWTGDFYVKRYFSVYDDMVFSEIISNNNTKMYKGQTHIKSRTTLEGMLAHNTFQSAYQYGQINSPLSTEEEIHINIDENLNCNLVTNYGNFNLLFGNPSEIDSWCRYQEPIQEFFELLENNNDIIYWNGDFIVKVSDDPNEIICNNSNSYWYNVVTIGAPWCSALYERTTKQINLLRDFMCPVDYEMQRMQELGPE